MPYDPRQVDEGIFNPVMGAVGLITQEVMRKKQENRAIKLQLMQRDYEQGQQEKLQNRQDLMLSNQQRRDDARRVEDRKFDIESKKWQGRISAAELAGKNDLFDPESRAGAYRGMSQLIEAGPEGQDQVPMPEMKVQPNPEMTLYDPPQDIAQAFKLALPPGAKLTLKQIQDLRQGLWEHQDRQGRNDGKAPAKEDFSRLNALLKVRENYLPKWDGENQISAGDPTMLAYTEKQIRDEMDLLPKPQTQNPGAPQGNASYDDLMNQLRQTLSQTAPMDATKQTTTTLPNQGTRRLSLSELALPELGSKMQTAESSMATPYQNRLPGGLQTTDSWWPEWLSAHTNQQPTNIVDRLRAMDKDEKMKALISGK